jgi:hypothetical protein
VVEELVRSGLGVAPAAVVVEAVGDDEDGGPSGAVVARHLVKGLLRDVYARGLALRHQQRGAALAVVRHHVGAPRAAFVGKRLFDGNQAGGDAAIPNEILHEVLAHPFLGPQAHPLPAHRVEDDVLALALVAVEVVRREVERLHEFGMRGAGVRGAHGNIPLPSFPSPSSPYPVSST